MNAGCCFLNNSSWCRGNFLNCVLKLTAWEMVPWHIRLMVQSPSDFLLPLLSTTMVLDSISLPWRITFQTWVMRHIIQATGFFIAYSSRIILPWPGSHTQVASLKAEPFPGYATIIYFQKLLFFLLSSFSFVTFNFQRIASGFRMCAFAYLLHVYTLWPCFAMLRMLHDLDGHLLFLIA